jgi:hypothetical protein
MDLSERSEGFWDICLRVEHPVGVISPGKEQESLDGATENAPLAPSVGRLEAGLSGVWLRLRDIWEGLHWSKASASFRVGDDAAPVSDPVNVGPGGSNLGTINIMITLAGYVVDCVFHTHDYRRFMYETFDPSSQKGSRRGMGRPTILSKVDRLPEPSTFARYFRRWSMIAVN